MKTHFNTVAVACGAVLLAGWAATAPVVGAVQDFQKASELERKGEVVVAFRA